MQNWSKHIKGRILVCPLNWGLGHASRCIPLIERLLLEGNEVVIATDGHPLALLRMAFPQLQWMVWPSYHIRYSSSSSQVGAMLRSSATIVKGIIAEHRKLNKLLKNEHFDAVISDNRFGLYSRHTYSVYITHQLMIKMPKGRLRVLEPFVHRLHCFVIAKYRLCLVPDLEGPDNLSGDLSHLYPTTAHTCFAGPWSRFSHKSFDINPSFDIVALISGPEPTRSDFEKFVVETFSEQANCLLIVRGLPDDISGKRCAGKITYVPHLPDAELAACLLGAEKIVCRSGYSSIMDLHALHCLHKAEFYPTPGQTEQEYLAEWHNARKKALSL